MQGRHRCFHWCGGTAQSFQVRVRPHGPARTNPARSTIAVPDRPDRPTVLAGLCCASGARREAMAEVPSRPEQTGAVSLWVSFSDKRRAKAQPVTGCPSESGNSVEFRRTLDPFATIQPCSVAIHSVRGGPWWLLLGSAPLGVLPNETGVLQMETERCLSIRSDFVRPPFPTPDPNAPSRAGWGCPGSSSGSGPSHSCPRRSS